MIPSTTGVGPESKAPGTKVRSIPKTKTFTTSELRGLIDGSDIDANRDIYDLGKLLLADSLDRAKQFDSKAMSAVGYSAVMLSLLVSAFLAKKSADLPPLTLGQWRLIYSAVMTVLVGAGYALRVVWVSQSAWFSDKDWIAPLALHGDDPQGDVRRCHILAIHHFRADIDSLNDGKSGHLRIAHVCLVLGGTLVVGAAILPVITRLFFD